MKINIFLSIVKAISAWLHGEGSAHFRAYTWPRIKRFTRQFINLGIYEQIEKYYKIVDDTFYKGSIELDPQDPAELVRLEQLAEQIEGTAAAGATSTDLKLSTFASIKDKLLIWKSIEQGNTYRCGTFTMNNMLRSFMLKLGLRPPLEVCGIDPLYLATKHGAGKTGTVMDNAFNYLKNTGYPAASWSPIMTNHNNELAALESSKTIDNALKFNITRTGNVKRTYSYEEAVELDRSLPWNWEMQVSISFSASLQYFGNLVPFLKKINGKYNLTRTGGHSVHGVRGSFSTWEDGEPGFVIIDSAYRSKEDGWRFLTASLFKYGILYVRFVEFAAEGEQVVTPTPTPTPTPSPITSDDEILAQNDIAFGDNSENVAALQRYLISEGIAIPDGPTTYFGAQTRVALKNWLDKHIPGNTYTGELWGPISRAKFIEVKQLG